MFNIEKELHHYNVSYDDFLDHTLTNVSPTIKRPKLILNRANISSAGILIIKTSPRITHIDMHDKTFLIDDSCFDDFKRINDLRFHFQNTTLNPFKNRFVMRPFLIFGQLAFEIPLAVHYNDLIDVLKDAYDHCFSTFLEMGSTYDHFLEKYPILCKTQQESWYNLLTRPSFKAFDLKPLTSLNARKFIGYLNYYVLQKGFYRYREYLPYLNLSLIKHLFYLHLFSSYGIYSQSVDHDVEAKRFFRYLLESYKKTREKKSGDILIDIYPPEFAEFACFINRFKICHLECVSTSNVSTEDMKNILLCNDILHFGFIIDGSTKNILNPGFAIFFVPDYNK